VEVVRQETAQARWAIARRSPTPALRPYMLGPLEGWEHAGGRCVSLREVPFPGVPLIFGLGTPWEIQDPSAQPDARESFVAGLHAAPSLVRPTSCTWSCIELRLTPLGAHQLLGWPMHELANRSVDVCDVFGGAEELTARLAEARSWAERFDLVEHFLERRLTDAAPASAGVEWSWQQLRRSDGRVSIGELAEELGWSHRRLIARFREQIGLAPKTAARVLRFDRAVAALRSARPPALAELAVECGYFDQAHLNRDFRELAGTTPTAFLDGALASGGQAA
jgi:AraC-like DNA-binding protein